MCIGTVCRGVHASDNNAPVSERTRLDQLLVERGLLPSREKARAVVLAGLVDVDGTRIDKPGTRVKREAKIELKATERFVSRGGYKLEHAMEEFGVSAVGRVAMDVGASTGGFTDCLLQRGAARVIAVDVGKGQLDWKLRNDPRVVVREGVNFRNLDATSVESVSLLVGDLSFISLTLVLPKIRELLAEGGEAVLLVKPQFEVGKGKVGKGGVVRDEALREKSVDGVEDAARAAGFDVLGRTTSPIKGAKKGNVEYLLHLKPSTIRE